LRSLHGVTILSKHVFFITQQPLLDQSLLIYWSFTIRLRHTRLGRTSLDKWSVHTETSTWQNTTLTTNRHPWRLLHSNPQS